MRDKGAPPPRPSRAGRGSVLATQLFGLSEQERTFIERADSGFGTMITEQGRVPFYNRLTDLECGYFTTRPDEAGEQPRNRCSTQ